MKTAEHGYVQTVQYMVKTIGNKMCAVLYIIYSFSSHSNKLIRTLGKK